MCGRNGASGGGCRPQIPAAILFDREGRKHSGPISPSIDSDAVRPLLDVNADGVTMNDDKTMPGFVRQERLADPSKVRLALLVECNPRPNSGMDKQIVSESARIHERP